MTRSLILGINGQDGSYLAEALLRRGHEVIGVGRNVASRYVALSPRFRYVQLDLRNVENLPRFVQETAPDFAFHAAAVHGAAGYRYEAVWRDMVAVNMSSLHVLLEHARSAAPGMRVIYAGSAKIFAPPLTGVIDETTPSRATCLYGIGKIASRDLISFYREHHRVAATNLTLFNHESVRRPPQYLLPTVARAIAAALNDPQHRVNLRTLDFRIDWSAAEELMEIAVEIAERSEEGEFVLASGTTRYGRDAIHDLFARHGLDANRHVVETSAPSLPPPDFRVSLDRLERAINRRPVKSLGEIVDGMVTAARCCDHQGG